MTVGYSMIGKDHACLYAFLVFSSEPDDSWFDEVESFSRDRTVMLITEDFRHMLQSFLRGLLG